MSILAWCPWYWYRGSSSLGEGWILLFFGAMQVQRHKPVQRDSAVVVLLLLLLLSSDGGLFHP